jgi:hypothetical protein
MSKLHWTALCSWILATQAAEPDTGDGKGVPVKMAGGREHKRMIRDQCDKR